MAQPSPKAILASARRKLRGLRSGSVLKGSPVRSAPGEAPTFSEGSRDTSSREFAVQPNSPTRIPTFEAYGHWQGVFDFFNERLFRAALPDCLITQMRRPRTLGYFCAGAFANLDGDVAHEISMNTGTIEARGDADSYSTLAHEMAHLWRHVFGRRNRKGGKGSGGYHDTVWADKMEAIGLMPSNTGAPGGSRTGYRMTHYIVENGSFDIACRELLIAGHRINWRDARGHDPSLGGVAAAASKNTRTRFVCTICDLKAWSRTSAKLSCTDCSLPLIATWEISK